MYSNRRDEPPFESENVDRVLTAMNIMDFLGLFQGLIVAVLVFCVERGYLTASTATDVKVVYDQWIIYTLIALLLLRLTIWALKRMFRRW